MRKHERGQTLVIFAVAALALVFFIGLAVDSGSLYITYGQLKRAVDAAAVAAANEFKKQDSGHESDVLPKMTNAAVEVLKLQNIDPDSVHIDIRLCDTNFDGVRDADLQTVAPDFYNRCPNTSAGKQARKLVWVQATQEAPLYFLHMLGFSNIPLTTESIAEAASVDMVIVFDLSESMGKDTPGYVNDDFNPAGCNASNTCQPLRQAKDAAKALIQHMYSGYDRVGIVTFDVKATPIYAAMRDSFGNLILDPLTHQPIYSLSSDLEGAIDALDRTSEPADGSGEWVPLHDAAPQRRLFWKAHPELVNPVDPEDRDGDGSDQDEPHPVSESASGNTCVPNDVRWDDDKDVPCDLSDKHDAFDLDGDGVYTEADNIPPGPTQAVIDTCTGCGIRIASNLLRDSGRSGSVWVMVFLSDGVPNLSDRPATIGDHSLDAYPTGFCRQNFWSTACIDWDWSPRYCIDKTVTGLNPGDTCPPNTTYLGTDEGTNLDYSTLDYARDMTDAAALTKSLNLNEPGGNEISIYTIGLGAAGNDPMNPDHPVGERLLRYMAAVGDDGDRETDPCDGVGPRQTCGQYYYAPSGDALQGIFLDIASRIYTRISE